MGVAQRAPAGVPEPQHAAELAQGPVVMAGRPGPGALAVPHELGEQVAHRLLRAEAPAFPHPGLLLADDLDHVGADEDGGRGAVDLGLLVAQPGDHPALGNSGRVDAGDGAERVEVHQQDLGGAPSGERLDQPGPHHRRMAEPGHFGFLPVAGDGHGLVAGQAEQLDVLQHAGQVGIADVVTLISLADRSFRAELVAADEPGVAVGERQPPLIAGRGGRVGPAVAHRPVEVAEEPEGAGDRSRVQRPAAGLTVGGPFPPPLLQERPELQRHGPQVRRVVRQGGVSEVPGERRIRRTGRRTRVPAGLSTRSAARTPAADRCRT